MHVKGLIRKENGDANHENRSHLELFERDFAAGWVAQNFLHRFGARNTFPSGNWSGKINFLSFFNSQLHDAVVVSRWRLNL